MAAASAYLGAELVAPPWTRDLLFRAMSAERLRTIREKLDRLRTLDRRMEAFGAAWGDVGHRYREEPRMMEMALADLERAIGGPLPAEYRAFLATVHGGGAGPGYGLAPPVARDGGDRFPFSRAQATEILERRRGDDRFAMLPRDPDRGASGCIVLSDQGCGWEDVLVLSGELRGTVWTFGEGWCPHAGKDGPVGFLDWYEAWLDANLAPGALTNDPEEIATLPADTAGINLRGKSLATWPDLARLAALRVLVLDQNRLKEIPAAIGRHAKLEQLSAGWNQIETLPEALGDCSALETIMLKSNAIGGLPGTIGKLGALRYLCLDFNGISSLPETIGGLGSLRELLVGSNRIREVPESIGGLGALQDLDLTRNPIARLPESIGSLGRLRSFALSEHELGRLPESMGGLQSLRRVTLDGSTTMDVGQACAVLARIEGLREVSLRSVGMTTVPPEMLKLRTSRLDLGGNGLGDGEIERLRGAMPGTEVFA